MKLLIITDGVYPFVIGGMQKHSHYLAKFLVLQGHDVVLVHCVPYNKALVTHEELCGVMGIENQSGFESICLRFPKPGNQPGHYLRESFAYSELIYQTIGERITSFDFIYAKGFCAWKILDQKSRGEKMPPVGVKFHGYEMFQKPAGLKSWFQQLMLRGPVKWNNRKADFVFSYGGKITGLIQRIGIDPERIFEIPTGIDEAWWRNAIRTTDAKEIRFVFVGRYERRKGIEELNAVLRELIATPGFHFHFVGPIPATAKINHRQITYHGTLGDPVALQSVLDQCDILVVPSHSEGMPNVIMEAMARGLAVVATDVGAVSAVVDSANGWFVEPGSVSSLKTVLTQILASDPLIIDQKKSSSLQRIKSFSWAEISRITAEKIGSRL